MPNTENPQCASRNGTYLCDRESHPDGGQHQTVVGRDAANPGCVTVLRWGSQGEKWVSVRVVPR